MGCTVTQESFDSLAACWGEPGCSLEWNPLFLLPAWLKLWWREFKPDAQPYLGAVRRDGEIIGIAPLLLLESRASIIGSTDVCDYLDFVVAPGAEDDFFRTLVGDLREKGISLLDLKSLRPDSTVLTRLVETARSQGFGVLCQPEDISVEMELPPTWDEYLERLTAKQRHEVRRKLRRLAEAGKVGFRIIEDSTAVRQAMNTFLTMFAESRSDKASFLTSRREAFFRSLADAMTGIGLLRLGVLELDNLPTAMIIYFNFNGGAYLYNSGYDRRYDSLSVGLMSKVLCIQECIREGKKRFDFLKGNEVYKYHLGGKEVPLSSCQITIR